MAVILAVVKVAQKADADARLAENADAQEFDFGFVHALIRLGKTAATISMERIMGSSWVSRMMCSEVTGRALRAIR